MSQHFAADALNRLEVSMLLQEQGIAELQPVYWRYPDGSIRLAALVQPGEAEVTAEALDIGLCDAPTPAVEKMIHDRVMDRVEELLAKGFELGLRYARTGKLPGETTEMIGEN